MELERWRLRFGRGAELRFLSHLELMRLWERALRRAGVPVAYSRGYTPHPHLSLALPLPVGVTSEAELLEVWLKQPVFLASRRDDIAGQLPAGVTLAEFSAQALPARAPALPALVCSADYRVSGQDEDVESAIVSFMGRTHLPWTDRRGEEVRCYDIRERVESLALIERGADSFVIAMRLRVGPGGAGRPDQVALALSFSPTAMHRTAINLRAP